MFCFDLFTVVLKNASQRIPGHCGAVLTVRQRERTLNDILSVPRADERDQASPDEDEDDEVRKLKVCIELKGLRLSKPAAGASSPDSPQIKQERPWQQQPRLVPPAQSIRERKLRPGEPEERAAAHRADINRKWVCEKLLNGKNELAAAQTAAAVSPEFS